MGAVEDAVQTMIRNLETKTGRSLAQWLSIARSSGRTRHRELLTFLKSEHSLTHGYANLIALEALDADEGPPAGGGDTVAGQYGGAKAGLRPIYEAIVKVTRGFGPDVEIAPKKAYASFRRTKQFAIVQPSTADRIDVGLNLKGVMPTRRLEPSGSFNSMVTHRVRVGSKSEVDKELVAWLRRAYNEAG